MSDIFQNILGSMQLSVMGNLIIALLSALIGVLAIALVLGIGVYYRLKRVHNRPEHVHLTYERSVREVPQEELKLSNGRHRGKKKKTVDKGTAESSSTEKGESNDIGDNA